MDVSKARMLGTFLFGYFDYPELPKIVRGIAHERGNYRVTMVAKWYHSNYGITIVIDSNTGLLALERKGVHTTALRAKYPSTLTFLDKRGYIDRTR